MAMSVVYTNFCGMLVSETRGGVERDYVPDTLGSTAALVDSSQTITDRWEYWPYGEVSQRAGAHPTSFTFVGMLGYFKDILDKMLYVRARHVRPDLARWLTVDPLWPPMPAYEYVGSRPSEQTDPSGLIWFRRIDCSPSQIDDIKNALTLLCGKFNNPSSPYRVCLGALACKVAHPTAPPWGSQADLVDFICNSTSKSDPLLIRCDFGLSCRRKHASQLPGWANPLILCPSAFEPGQSLFCIMAHEISHKGGHSHKSPDCLKELGC